VSPGGRDRDNCYRPARYVPRDDRHITTRWASSPSVHRRYLLAGSAPGAAGRHHPSSAGPRQPPGSRDRAGSRRTSADRPAGARAV